MGFNLSVGFSKSCSRDLLASFFFFLITLGLEFSDTNVYEPSSELLLITAKQLFLNRELCRSVQLSVESSRDRLVTSVSRDTYSSLITYEALGQLGQDEPVSE